MADNQWQAAFVHNLHQLLLPILPDISQASFGQTLGVVVHEAERDPAVHTLSDFVKWVKAKVTQLIRSARAQTTLPPVPVQDRVDAAVDQAIASTPGIPQSFDDV